MGGSGPDWKRIGIGIGTGGLSELDRAGIGPTAGLTGKPGTSAEDVKNPSGGPTPPDFDAAAREQARTSRNDVNGPFGNARWSQTPDGRWALDIGMSDGLQGAADRITAGLGNQLDPQATREQAIDSAYRMQTSRLDPRFAQEQAALEAKLANEGFSRGDAGWSTGMDEFGRGKNDAYQQALLGAQSGAGNTAFAQSLAANMQPYQQLGAINSLGSGAGMASLGQADPVQALAAAMSRYNGELQQYGIEQANKNGMLGGAGSLAPLLLAG